MTPNRLNKLVELADKMRTASIDADLFSQFFYFAPLLCCIADERGYFVHVNFKWEKVSGYSERELCSKPWISFVHSDDISKTVEIGKEMSAGREVLDFVNRYQKKNGDYFSIRWIATHFGNGLAYAIGELV